MKIKAAGYGAILGMIFALVWVFTNIGAALLVLALTIVGAVIGALIARYGGIKAIISQVVNDD